MTHSFPTRRSSDLATDAIRAEEGSGIISVNGAAAHRAQPGDLVIICAYGACDEAEAEKFKPTLVYVDRQNVLTHTNDSIPAQAARSEEHTSELQSLMRISYAVFCLKKKTSQPQKEHHKPTTQTHIAAQYITSTHRQ